MVKSELIEKLSERAGITLFKAEELVEPLIHGMRIGFLAGRGPPVVPLAEQGRGVAGLAQPRWQGRVSGGHRHERHCWQRLA